MVDPASQGGGGGWGLPFPPFSDGVLIRQLVSSFPTAAAEATTFERRDPQGGWERGGGTRDGRPRCDASAPSPIGKRRDGADQRRRLLSHAHHPHPTKSHPRTTPSSTTVPVLASCKLPLSCLVVRRCCQQRHEEHRRRRPSRPRLRRRMTSATPCLLPRASLRTRRGAGREQKRYRRRRRSRSASATVRRRAAAATTRDRPSRPPEGRERTPSLGRHRRSFRRQKISCVGWLRRGISRAAGRGG